MDTSVDNAPSGGGASGPSKPAKINPRSFAAKESNIPLESPLARARNFLLETSEESDTSLYEHLSEILMRVLATRKRNAADAIEAISAEVKRERFRNTTGQQGVVKTSSAPGAGVAIAQKQAILYKLPRNEQRGVPPPAEAGEIPDVIELSNLFEWAGVGFGREETFKLVLAMRKLVEDQRLASVRLWGKIHGRESHYYVVEAESREGVDPSEIEPHRQEDKKSQDPDDDFSAWFPASVSVPRMKQRPTPEYHPEIGGGVNRYVYYVCAFPGAPWTRLPLCKPEKLQIARKIRKMFTGKLDHQIVSYPAFNDSEAQYLRCQIARISGATVVSPAGYYTFDGEEMDPEDMDGSASIIINPEYEGLPTDSLLQLSNWVHHTPYILPQGRSVWANPFAGVMAAGDDDSMDDADRDDMEHDDIDTEAATGGGSHDFGPESQPESGPAILSSLAADDDFGGSPSWTSHICSGLMPPKYTPVCLRSLRWPGAVVVSYQDKFANLYVGDGLKELDPNSLGLRTHVAPVPGVISDEYQPMEQEIVLHTADEDGNLVSSQKVMSELEEQADPSCDDEKAFEEQQRETEEEEEVSSNDDDDD